MLAAAFGGREIIIAVGIVSCPEVGKSHAETFSGHFGKCYDKLWRSV